MDSPTADRRGAALIETLVAISILSVAMTLLTQLVVRGLEESASAQQRMKGVLLAQERMEEILAQRGELAGWEQKVDEEYERDPVSGMYRFAEPGRAAFRWRWRIQDASDHPGLTQVTVWVHWRLPQGENFRPHATLRTLLVPPGGPEPERDRQEIQEEGG
jgi:type II secretory pathway pseudopilin PulG